MPFTKGQTDDFHELRDLAYGWGKIVTRRAYGEEGPGLDLDFDSIESLAVDMGQAVIRGTIEEVLRSQLQRLGDHQPCPGGNIRHPLFVIETRGLQLRSARPSSRSSHSASNIPRMSWDGLASIGRERLPVE